MGTMTKWPVQKHTEHHKTRSKQGRNRQKEITIFLCFSIFLFFIFNFQLLKGLLQKILNYRLGTVNENHWGFKPVFRCSKPHTFSTLSREEKEKNCPFILFNKATRELNKTTGK